MTELADLVEDRIGPVTAAAEVLHVNSPTGPHSWNDWWRDLLLLSDRWATVLHLAITA
jgi:hypothetical protein